MARWKLTQPHYLAGTGTKWEYTENSRTNGKPIRKQYDVPQYLHPDDPSDWTEVEMTDQRGNAVQGIIVVCHEGKGNVKDIVFTGKPTPDMIPLDDEAKAISAKLPMGMGFAEEMPEGGYAGRILEGLGKQLADAMAATTPAQVNPQMDKFLESQDKLSAQLAALLAALAPAVVATKSAERRA